MNMKKLLVPAVIIAIIAVAGLMLTEKNATNILGSDAKPELVVGVLTDLTSYTAEYGQQEMAGLQVLADQINSSASKSSIKLLIQDTKGSPKDAVNGVNQILITESKPRLIFSALSSVSMAILPVTSSRDVLVLCNATTKSVVDSADNSIRNFPDPSQEIDVLFENVVVPLSINSVGVIYINDEYGQSMAKLIGEKIHESIYSTPISEAYGFDAADFRAIIRKLIGSEAESVILVGYGSQVGSLIRQLKENGFTGQIMVPSLIVNTDSVSSAAGAALNGVIFNGYDYQHQSDELNVFASSFEQLYQAKQSDIGALAYVGAKIILDHTSAELGTAAAINQLEKIGSFSTILGEVKFEERSFVYPMKVFTVSDSKIVPFTSDKKDPA